MYLTYFTLALYNFISTSVNKYWPGAPMKKLILPFVETMATQVCNLSCQGCSNYSDLKHNGYVSWDKATSQIEQWLDILELPDFGIIGGEPLINPEIEQWLLGLRKLLPNTQIRFTTNGLLLQKFPNLLPLLNQIGNCVFKITVHVHDNWLEDYISQIQHHDQWHTVNEFGIIRLKNKNNVRFQVNRPTNFIKTYRNTYKTMEPYNSDPLEAFDNCMQKTCPLLYNGKIYKCSTAGLLTDVLAKFNNPNASAWQSYIDPGISPTSSMHDIQSFINNFGQAHQQCAQCPTSKDLSLDHKITVVKANQKQ